MVDPADDTWQRVLDTDLTAPFVLAREADARCSQPESGRIVNISSILGILGRDTVAAYVACKHGLIGLTKTLAVEFGPDVTANASHPATSAPSSTSCCSRTQSFNDMLEQRTAAHRWGTPEDLRGTLLLLASDAGAYITGQSIVVDGGLTTILA